MNRKKGGLSNAGDNITKNEAQYAFDIVKKICTEVGPGLPGSPQERERASMIKKELESHLGAGNVATEEFTFAPGSALYGPPISALLTLLAVLLNISGAFHWSFTLDNRNLCSGLLHHLTVTVPHRVFPCF